MDVERDVAIQHGGTAIGPPDSHSRDLPELPREPLPGAWVQLGLTLKPLVWTDLCQCIARDARELLSADATNFFYMFKPPGMRVRFEVPDPYGRPAVRRLATQWRADGLVEEIAPGVYEPEYPLFGGPASMPHVHRLFTTDSLAWLDLHGLAGQAPGSVSVVNFSLAVLRGLFDRVGIVGWEHRDVWDRIHRVGGRRLGASAVRAPAFARTARSIRQWWAREADLIGALSPAERAVVGNYHASAAPDLDRWRTEYFDTERAQLGPREAMAYFVVFHWNRGGVSPTQQAVVVEALRAEGGPE